ncbi:conserved hypothetical protein [Neospora caninum Liverpool]|uniref:Transmembrane protein n=1 Tax=Neospora caninum (strain Liverpool) TaxID=572307 RepID=F0V7Q4_NEOCL|nr:conserved hypothetical protein [Neospora caninum Liverpool]CBZ49745.1 conserved hypothetical protein [Neospora caninum Liverpool]CEL64329.1 TPA: hypothetical protein BN1204_002320 [Neospora caninum Liverpool]|eukprot:XP_003879780.1 conserved hypothetical protein [Neospora caninum Liverpool]
MAASRHTLRRLGVLAVAALVALACGQASEAGKLSNFSRLGSAFRASSPHSKRKPDAPNGENEAPASESPGASHAVDRFLDALSSFATQVGKDVKNGVLQQVSQVLTSEAYKKAKHFVVRTPINMSSVRHDLRIFGYGMVYFLRAYSQVPPEKRPPLYKRLFDTNSSLRRVRRKYLHLEAYLAPDETFEALDTLRNIILEVQAVLERETQHEPDRPRKTLQEIRGQSGEVRRVFEAVYTQLARVLSILSFVLTQEETVLPELGAFTRQMIPRMKRLFTAAWRLSAFMPPRNQLEIRRTLVDYLNDFAVINLGLGDFAIEILASTKIDRSYDPKDDYYAVPEFQTSILDLEDQDAFNPPGRVLFSDGADDKAKP